MAELNDGLEDMGSNISAKAVSAMKAAAQIVRDEIAVSMAHTPRDYSKSYYHHNSKTPHHPSMPYNPPAIDSGDLRESLHWDVRDEGDRIVMEVGSIMTEEYPAWLEKGTSRMAPRPWLRPAFEKKSDQIIDIVKRGVFGEKSE